MKEMGDHGLEAAVDRWYAQYQGIAIRVDDPQLQGRILVRVPNTTGDYTAPLWAYPNFPGSGWYWPPYKGDRVHVNYEFGDPRFPRYSGCWYGRDESDASEVPMPFQPDAGQDPTRRGFMLQNGMMLMFEEAPDKETVQLVWSNGPDSSAKKAIVSIDSNGSISLVTNSGRRLVLDEQNGQLFYADVDGSGNAVNLMSADQKQGWSLMSSSGGQVKSVVVIGINGKVSVQAQDSVSVSAPSISLEGTTAIGGSGASHPIPFGDLLASLLNSLIAQVAAITVTCPPSGGPSSPPLNAGAIAALAGQLQDMLSKSHKVG